MSRRLDELNKKMSVLSKKKDGLKAQEDQIKQQIKNEMDKEREQRIHKCGEYLYKHFVEPDLLSLEELYTFTDYLFTSEHVCSQVQQMIDKKQDDPNADVISHIKELIQKQLDKDKGKAAFTPVMAPIQPKPQTNSAPAFPARNANPTREVVETTGEFTTSDDGDNSIHPFGR